MAEHDEQLAEIEADIRAARAEQFFTKAGKIAVIISVIVVLGTIIHVTSRHFIRESAIEKTTLLMQGVERMNVQDYRGAITIFDSVPEDTGKLYYALALLYKAQAQQALGENTKETYEALSDQDNSLAPLGHILGAGESAEPDRESPFYFTEQERYAWQVMEKGNREQAIKLLNEILLDPEAPADIRNRIKTAMAHLAPQGVAQ